jgi:shikimate kinase
MPFVTLIGYRGCGKSTVAASLAERLGCRWEDADAVLEASVGCSIAEMIGLRGEAAFRTTEAEILASTLSLFAGVLATGGGVVLRPENRRLLREAFRPVVWLSAPVAVIQHRLAGDPTTATRRPALAGGDPLAEVAAAVVEREPLYRECADHVIDTSAADPAAVVEAIVRWLRQEWQP